MDDTQAAAAAISSGIATVNFVGYFLAALLGQLGCAGKMWLAREIDCVFDRFRTDWRSTLNSVIGNCSAVAVFGFAIPWESMPLQNVIFGLHIPYMVPVAAVLLGLAQGYSVDSGLNKSTRKAWTPAEREAAAAKKADGTT